MNTQSRRKVWKDWKRVNWSAKISEKKGQFSSLYCVKIAFRRIEIGLSNLAIWVNYAELDWWPYPLILIFFNLSKIEYKLFSAWKWNYFEHLFPTIHERVVERYFLGFHPLPKAPRRVQILLSETVFSCVISFPYDNRFPRKYFKNYKSIVNSTNDLIFPTPFQNPFKIF